MACFGDGETYKNMLENGKTTRRNKTNILKKIQYEYLVEMTIIF